MFGSDRFAFETPNVIDPGDAPPSAPRRVSLEVEEKKTDHHDDNDSMSSFNNNKSTTTTSSSNGSSSSRNSTYRKQRANRLLHDIQDLDLSPSQDEEDGLMKLDKNVIYDPYDDEEDEEERHPDKARRYAASLLNDSHAKNGSTNHHHNKSKETIALTRTVQLDAPSSPHRRSRRYVYLHKHLSLTTSFNNPRSKWCKVGTALLLLLVIVVIAVVVSKNNRNDNTNIPDNAFSSQSARHFQIVQFLVENHVSSPADLRNADAPQAAAAQWIADQDPLQVEPPHNLFADYHFIQRYVLAVLYFAFQGRTSWKTNANFLSLQHECAWFTTARFDHFIGTEYAVGVTCDANDLQVTDLYLPAVGLQGAIPTELAHLSRLEILSLADNAVTGTLPTNLQRLSHLIFFDVKYNALTGSVPAWIGNDLTQLQVLGLSNNMLTGSVPASWSTLGRLHTLALDDNDLTGRLDFLQTLTNLEYLYADRNQFDSVLTADSFANLVRLRELDLSSNQLRGNELPALLFQQHTTSTAPLHVIDLGHNQLTATLPSSAVSTWRTNTELDFLSLRGNQLQGTIPDSFVGSFGTLKHLDLQDNRLTGSIPTTLDKLTQLEYLAMGYNDFFPAELPPSLIALSGLKELSLPAMQLTGRIPVWEAQYLPNLMYVDLSNNQLRSSIPDTLWNLRNLEYLLLQDNQLTGTVPTAATTTNFQVLALHRNTGLTGDVSAVCQTPLTNSETVRLVVTDCTLQCDSDCCPTCCSPSKETCALDQDLEQRLTPAEGLWEFNYERTPFAFDPDMLDEVGAFQIIYQERSP